MSILDRHLTVLPATLVLAITALLFGGCRSSSTPAIADLLADHPDKFAAIMAKAEQHRVQILLSEVVSEGGRSKLRRSNFRAGTEYIYPASAIKLCAAIASMQAIEATNAAGPEALDCPLRFHPLFTGETLLDRDPSNLQGGAVTLRHENRKMFLVSDNDSFNRLYEFIGHRELNERMWALGLRSVVINHRLSVGRSPEENRRTPRIDIACAGGDVTIPARTSDLDIRNADMPGLFIGKGYMAAGKQLKLEPMDFTARNGISIEDLQDVLVMLARPDIDLGKGPLKLSASHRRFLLDTMAEYPADSTNPVYPRKDYPDEWGKFYLPGLLRVGGRMRDDLTICNKVGQAYGFTIDNAYIADKRSGREFFLTAVIYTNADEILNDDTYEYDAVAFPFMADVAEVAARAVWQEPSEK